MGLSASKEFSDLYIAENGADTSADNLKKLKIVHVLASGIPAPKNNTNWKNLELANNNEQTIIINLKAGARFIQQGRVNKENVLIVTEQQNNDSTAFLVAYFMLMSGLPVKCAKEAVSKLNDKIKVTSKYDNELEEIRNSNTAKALREELLKTSGVYPPESLTEDVKKIYRLANITPPSPEEIRLEDARRISIIEAAWAKAAQEKELADKVDKTKRFSQVPSPSPSPSTKANFFRRFSSDIRKDSLTESKDEKTAEKIPEKIPEKPKPVESPKVKEQLSKPETIDIKSAKKIEDKIRDSWRMDTNFASPIQSPKEVANKPVVNGSLKEEFEPKKTANHRISIIYALSTESTEADAVDEYLRTHSEEERMRNRRPVTITRALTRLDDD